MVKEQYYSYTDISNRLRRSASAINNKLRDLGIKERPMPTKQRQRWTKEEMAKLNAMLASGSCYEVIGAELSQ